MNNPALTSLLLAVLIGLPFSSHGAIHTRTSHPQAPSYNVRIVASALPSGSTSIDIGPDLWSIQGVDLRGLLAHVYNVDPARIELPSSESEQPRFDVSVALTGDESDATIRKILTAALTSRFHLVASLETRSVEAYVLTAAHSGGSGLHPVRSSGEAAHGKHAREDSGDDAPTPETITVSGRHCTGNSSTGITGRAASVAALAHSLEDVLDRPVIDETRIAGVYNFQVPESHGQQELFAQLHNSLGLEITTAHRELAILAIHTTAQSNPAPDQTAFLQQPTLLP